MSDNIKDLIDKNLDGEDLKSLIEHFKKLAEALGNGTIIKMKKGRESCNEMLQLIGELEDALK